MEKLMQVILRVQKSALFGLNYNFLSLSAACRPQKRFWNSKTSRKTLEL